MKHYRADVKTSLGSTEFMTNHSRLSFNLSGFGHGELGVDEARIICAVLIPGEFFSTMLCSNVSRARDSARKEQEIMGNDELERTIVRSSNNQPEFRRLVRLHEHCKRFVPSVNSGT